MRPFSGLLPLDENAFRWFCALTLGLFFLALATVCMPTITYFAGKVGVSVQEKPLTELYFSDHMSLPKSAKAAQEYSFDVTIESHEVDLKVFSYEVVESDESGVHVKVLDSGSVSLLPGDLREITVLIAPRLLTAQSKISINMHRIANVNPESNPGPAEMQIHFWLKRR